MLGFIRVSRIRGVLEGHLELADRCHRLEMQVKQLADNLSALEGQHASLRGTVNGLRGGRPRASVTPITEIPPGDKQALRRALLPQHLQAPTGDP